MSNAVIDSIMMEQKPETVKITLGEEKLKNTSRKAIQKQKWRKLS